ncbi:MAG: hypothetical protein Q4D14_03640, partial [Bacteroidales bacterium]|nr:hypothetical protein [Bacteroidales bacterium]
MKKKYSIMVMILVGLTCLMVCCEGGGWGEFTFIMRKQFTNSCVKLDSITASRSKIAEQTIEINYYMTKNYSYW